MTSIAVAVRSGIVRYTFQVLVVVVALCGGGRPVVALYGGGGAPTTDCLTVFDTTVNFPPARPSMIRCTDGDPTCDDDGVVNGVCAFPVGLCANSSADPRCTMRGVQSITVDHALDNGQDPKFDTDFQSFANLISADIATPTSTVDQCTAAPTTIHVPIRGPFGMPGRHYCTLGLKILKVTTKSVIINRRITTDVDLLRFYCLPAARTGVGCDPSSLYTSTYDRLQSQVFTQTCAVATCHDSQTQQSDLVLENSAFPGNLVDVIPTNPVAAGAGWKRIAAGDPSTSYLYRKIAGDLPDTSYGARMPWHRAPVERYLKEAIRLWILDGANTTGWVAGTN